jgi:hypothetical protein
VKLQIWGKVVSQYVHGRLIQIRTAQLWIIWIDKKEEGQSVSYQMRNMMANHRREQAEEDNLDIKLGGGYFPGVEQIHLQGTHTEICAAASPTLEKMIARCRTRTCT